MPLQVDVYKRQERGLHEEVVCLLVIGIGDELYTVVKEGEVEPDVIGVGLFPCLLYTSRS